MYRSQLEDDIVIMIFTANCTYAVFILCMLEEKDVVVDLAKLFLFRAHRHPPITVCLNILFYVLLHAKSVTEKRAMMCIDRYMYYHLTLAMK